MSKSKPYISIRDIAQIGMMIAIIEVCKFALSGIPNVELTSFWLIMFTLFFGWKIVVVVPVFILIEGAVYGMNLWWFMYLYAWPLLVGITWIFRKNMHFKGCHREMVSIFFPNEQFPESDAIMV